MNNYFEKESRENPLESLMMLVNGCVPSGGIIEWKPAYVTSADIGDKYLSGCEGSIKNLKGYNKTGFVGMYVFEYTSVDYPSNTTSIKFLEEEV